MNTPPTESPPSGGPRRRGPPRRIEVTAVETLSPLMRRITFGGASLAGFALTQPASYIKLFFPEAGQTEPPVVSPDGPRPSTVRTYTPRRFDAEALTLEVDFVLHGEGIASPWAEQAAPHQPVLMGGPGPGYTLPAGCDDFLLIGDDSALPAIETILEALPGSARVTALIEIVDASEERPLPGAATTTLRWAHRGSNPRDAGHATLQAIAHLPDIAPATHVYIACEAGAMRRIRQWLIEQRGVPKAQIVGRGYWKLDDINHPDHDYGNDG